MHRQTAKRGHLPLSKDPCGAQRSHGPFLWLGGASYGVAWPVPQTGHRLGAQPRRHRRLETGLLEFGQYFLALVFVGDQNLIISIEQYQRLSCVVAAIVRYRSNDRQLPVHMSLRAGNVVLDLMQRLGIVPELVFFLDQKPLQKGAGSRVGLRSEPITKVSDVFPRDELVHGPALPNVSLETRAVAAWEECRFVATQIAAPLPLAKALQRRRRIIGLSTVPILYSFSVSE